MVVRFNCRGEEGLLDACSSPELGPAQMARCQITATSSPPWQEVQQAIAEVSGKPADSFEVLRYGEPLGAASATLASLGIVSGDTVRMRRVL